MPSYVSSNELLSITTFDEPKKDATVGVINSKTKTKLKDNEKEKASNEVTGNKDNVREVDTGANNGKQSFKKRKYSSEKLFVTDESDIKIKKKKKEAADQNITDQQDERRKIPKAESEDKDNTCDNEINAADNGRQSSKKRKYSSEKLFVTDENDIKVKKKRKAADQNITYQQNEKEKVSKEELEGDKDNSYNNEIDAEYDNGRQGLKKEKYAAEKSLVADQSDVKVQKRKKENVDQTITDQQDEKEKMPKEESEDKDNTYDNEIDIADDNGQQSLKKKKLTPEKSCIEGEREVTENSNIEYQEIPSKNRNKITEKKKRRLTIDDTIVANDISGEALKKECQKPATNTNKNKTTQYEEDENDETNALLQTEKHSTRDFDMRNSDIEETSVDERKKKKNRKKRSKVQSNNICSKIGLQVMAKSDWKRLRNKYLDLQRQKMSELKLHLRKAEVERGGIMTKKGYHDKTGQNISNTSHDKSKHENDNGKPNEEKKSFGRVDYAPGIIVKIEMDEPCTDLQSFKVY